MSDKVTTDKSGVGYFGDIVDSYDEDMPKADPLDPNVETKVVEAGAPRPKRPARKKPNQKNWLVTMRHCSAPRKTLIIQAETKEDAIKDFVKLNKLASKKMSDRERQAFREDLEKQDYRLTVQELADNDVDEFGRLKRKPNLFRSILDDSSLTPEQKVKRLQQVR